MPELVTPGFLDAPAEFCGWEGARFAILPMPYDSTCSYGVGCRHGPAAILDASLQVEYYDDDLGLTPYEAGIATLRPVAQVASGPADNIAAIEEVADEIVVAGKIPVGLGGEHSVSLALYRALARRYPGLSVLQIDAHLDLRAAYQGSPYSHACVMRRILEEGARTVQVGIRSGDEDEWALVAERNLTVFRAREIVPRPAESWIPKVLAALPAGPLFVTVDLDGFDPSVIPGTGTPEPGGLSWYQGLALLEAVCAARPVVGFDVVELQPVPGSRVSDFAAAKLVHKLMGYVLKGAPRGG
ncbi:MAG: agmatinase [Pseudomonadota bacterium]